jgi:hypothetical protein
MFYTIYKITNLINNKYYIGKHQTKKLDDDYMGSGNLLKRAITKYSLENFKKEILHIFDNEEEMNAKEKELVVICEESYNLCDGGKGGFSYINRSDILKFKGKRHTVKTKEKLRLAAASQENRHDIALFCKENKINGMSGKTHSDITKQKMSGPRGKYNVQKFGVKRGPYKKTNQNSFSK